LYVSIIQHQQTALIVLLKQSSNLEINLLQCYLIAKKNIDYNLQLKLKMNLTRDYKQIENEIYKQTEIDPIQQTALIVITQAI
jgi:hypothetical protein